jgi:hypothetical protein
LEGEALSREIAPGFTVGDAVNNYKNIFENPSNYVKENPNAVELAQQGLKELTERYGTKPSVGYDPDKIVPSKDLRDFVTDMQRDKIAAASKDFAPSVREEIKSKIAEPAQKFLDDYIDRAASKGPEIAKLADEYRASNERMRGLITINDVADQRLGLARTNSLAGKTPMMSPVTKAIAGSGVTGLVAGAASGHVAPAAVIAGAGLAAAGGKALAERALISLIRAKAAGSVTAAMVEQAIRSGVPRAAALAASGLTQYARGQ